MDARENLFYALGNFVYAVAKADGAIQRDEEDKLRQIVKEEGEKRNFGYDLSEITFQMSDKDKRDVETAFTWAENAFKLGDHHFTPELKEAFIAIMEKVAEAFPPKTAEENEIIQKFEALLK